MGSQQDKLTFKYKRKIDSDRMRKSKLFLIGVTGEAVSIQSLWQNITKIKTIL